MPDWRKTFDDGLKFALTATDDELKEVGFRGLEFLLDDAQPPAPEPGHCDPGPQAQTETG